MEQPLTKPNHASANDNKKSTRNSNSNSNEDGRKRKLPTPKELIEHYESQGMDRQEASVKVIQDLQNALFRLVTSSSSSSSSSSNNNTNNGIKEGRLLVAETSRKLNVINTRLLNIETKLDSKPGHAATFAVGLTSGAVLRGIGAVFPQVLSAVAQIWNSVRSTTTRS